MDFGLLSFAIVPAAGLSLRMGKPKLLLPWRGKAVIEHTIEAWRMGGVDQIVAVVRVDDAPLAELVAKQGVGLAPADPPPADMKASLQWGLSYIERSFRPSADDVWLTAPADLPSLNSSVIRNLLAAHDRNAPAVLVAAHNAKRGHPVLFPWSHAAEVARLAEGESLRQMLDRAGALLVECGEGAVSADLDTPDDYERLLDRSGEM